MNSSDANSSWDFRPLRLSGIAPNVLRELSGIYPDFVSAFKELVSNAYDADATEVMISLASDLSTITIEDNGSGMTLFEFQKDYVRIGGSAHRRGNVELTPGGRQPIGRKGIGFLAVARYCHQVEIQSYANRVATFREEILLEVPSHSEAPRRIPFFRGPFASELVPFVTVHSIQCGASELSPSEYSQDGRFVELSAQVWRRYEGQTLVIKYAVDHRMLEMEATVDYEYLLNLEDKHDLETLQDFYRARVIPITNTVETSSLKKPSKSFTRVRIHLRDFTQQELNEPKRSGWVRNIASASGQERFIWQLSRSVPVAYYLSSDDLESFGLELLATPMSPTPFSIQVVDAAGNTHELKRPLLGRTNDIDTDNFDELVPVKRAIRLEVNGMKAQGYILGFSEPIFPAELRGIAIRVRGVEIGNPDFLGVESDLPVKYRPFLNQVMGEVIVTEGLNAISAIVPGREGFYNENAQFQALFRHLVGDGMVKFGVLGQVLKQLREQNQVESSVNRIVQEARRRRKAFLDVSQAITAQSISSSNYGRALRRLFSRSDIVANGLCSVPEYKKGVPAAINNWTVELSDLPEKHFQIDTKNEVVRLDRDAERWAQPLYMLNREFEVSLRNGKPNDPVCEIDFLTNTIYINWMHPTRGEMGDVLFVKSALFWRIAYLAADGDVDLMMNMAHRLLSLSV